MSSMRIGFCSCIFWALAWPLLSGHIFSNAQSILSATTMGINYGQVADNLPSPELVVGLLRTNNISKIKLYSVNATVLKAFANTGIEIIVGMGNEYVSTMAQANQAAEWIQENIQAYLPATKITGIAVGNEVLTGSDAQLIANLVPAMKNIHTALVKIGAAMDITITTPHSLAVLGNSFPPSAGYFRQDLTSVMKPLLDFLSQIGAPFFINAYPYFAYKDEPNQVSLQYVLFEPNAGQVDPNNNAQYDNMLYAQIDAVYSALSALGYANLEVTVSETGWPSMGDTNEAGATPQNAQAYNKNLMQLLAQNQGTPLRPRLDVKAYIFALFNEDMKPGPNSERNYGLFKPDGTPTYNVGLVGSLHTSQSPISSTSTASSPTSSSDSTEYTFASSAKETRSVLSVIIYLHIMGLCSFLLGLPFRP
uniref:glucan endo-1,3-beta-D-glucosidase n=1 Tax=Araucaria cunninghamii TaxID=56994 RepID=A0A0D6R032_ARACU